MQPKPRVQTLVSYSYGTRSQKLRASARSKHNYSFVFVSGRPSSSSSSSPASQRLFDQEAQMRDNSSKSGGKTAMMKRKGPWTEQEDAQLVWFVRLLGERRWDFLAQVSGLRRTGKSCRLRWVNYLHPGLKRGRMTAEEERLILQLHSQWGSRWSRIARRLPGRTDNEIKNYWRTLTRKLTKKTTTTATPETEKKKDSSSLTASDSSSSSASSSSSLTASAETGCGTEEEMGGGTEEAGETEEETTAASEKKPEKDMEMEELWNEIAAAEMAAAAASWPGLHAEELLLPPSSPPAWEDYSLWRIDDQEYYSKMEHAALR